MLLWFCPTVSRRLIYLVSPKLYKVWRVVLGFATRKSLFSLKIFIFTTFKHLKAFSNGIKRNKRFKKPKIMLIRFIVENYLSFKDETEFNMLTGAPRRLKHHVHEENDLELLKMAAIYGANGSGKSNLVASLTALRNLVTSKNLFLVQEHARKFRLNKDFAQKPTYFEVEFIHNHKTFLYAIKIHQYKILEECLYVTHTKQESELIFDRKLIGNQIKIKFNEQYQKTPQDKYRIELYENEILKDDVSLLWQLAQSKEGFDIIKTCYDWFISCLRFVRPDYSLMKVMLNNAPIFQFVKQFIKQFNTGISDFEFQKVSFEHFFGDNYQTMSEQLKQALNIQPQIYLADFFNLEQWKNDTVAIKENNEYWVNQLIMYHNNDKEQNIIFKSNEESDGTIRLLDLLTAFYFVLNEPCTVFIDEIDRSIHPYLLKKMLEKFSENHEIKGQLIFTTHESNLLDQNMLRQDEIWLVEKNKEGATQLYPMSDFDIRHDLDIRKGYLNGRFGAIPFLGDFKNLNWGK